MSSNLSLIIAGGEIAMTIADGRYCNSPGLSPDELFQWLEPSLAEGVTITDWTRQPSCHFTLRMASDLITVVSQQVVAGAQGVVVLCGTGALEEMVYLADLLWSYPQPLIFAAAKLPSAKMGSDAPAVLNESVIAARSRHCWGKGALVCTQGELYAAADLIEFNNSGRSGPVSLACGPVGEVVNEEVILWQTPKRSQSLDSSVIPSRNVELVYSAVGAGEILLEALAADKDISGLVIAGFGGGSVHPAWIPYIKTMLRNDIPVVMTSRCNNGRVTALANYEGSFTRLREMGVLDGGDLSPLKARIKLAVGIGAGFTGQALQDYLLDH